jgi:hypothetical protein
LLRLICGTGSSLTGEASSNGVASVEGGLNTSGLKGVGSIVFCCTTGSKYLGSATVDLFSSAGLGVSAM